MSEDEIEREILAYLGPHWRKVAMVISRVSFTLTDNPAPEGLHEEIASKIADLVAAGRLESVGDISDWRFSEVRKP